MCLIAADAVLAHYSGCTLFSTINLPHLFSSLLRQHITLRTKDKPIIPDRISEDINHHRLKSNTMAPKWTPEMQITALLSVIYTMSTGAPKLGNQAIQQLEADLVEHKVTGEGAR